MFENISRKKILIVMGIVLAIAVLSWLMYLALRPREIVIVPNENVNGGIGQLPGSGGANTNQGGGTNLPINEPINTNANIGVEEPTELPNGQAAAPIAVGGITNAPVVTTDNVIAPQAGAGDLRYYSPRDCTFYRSLPDGSRVPLTATTYCGVQSVTWAPGTGGAVLEFPDGANIFYDFNNKKQYTLPKEMTAFSFSPDGSKIAGKFLGDQPADRWIVSVSPDGSGLVGIEPMGDNADKVNVEWAANNQVIALSRTGQAMGLYEQQVLLVGFNGENFPGLYVNGRGFEPKWAPDGVHLLYSAFNDKTNFKPKLWLTEASTDRVGANLKDTNLYTWVDKCTVTKEEAYCAVPKELPDGVSFAPELANGVPDSLWRVDLATGSTALIATPVNEQGLEVGASNLTVSEDGKYLYFRDLSTGQLRKVQLKP